MTNKCIIAALPEELEGASELLGLPVFYSGVGKVNAAIAAQKAINNGYTDIINIGSCGSLKHPAGQLVAVGTVLQDIDGSPLCAYGETPFEEKSASIVLNSALADTCFSTDYFYDAGQRDKYSSFYLERIDSCSVFDMECFAIAKACQKSGVLFSAYKWVSDDGDKGSWEENCQIGLAAFLKMMGA
jgi:adenosylhomocysteine nucleosidase